MKRLVTRNRATFRHLKAHQTDADPDVNVVRVFKRSPEEVALQIWRGRSYALISLSPSEAKEIISAFQAAVNEVEGE